MKVGGDVLTAKAGEEGGKGGPAGGGGGGTTPSPDLPVYLKA